ncbi:MAG TPA: TonB-dependent receptor [Opitutaceae bacterium]|jgi:vitamin B12 transporter
MSFLNERRALPTSILLIAVLIAPQLCAQLTVDPLKLSTTVTVADDLLETGAAVGTDYTVVTSKDLVQQQRTTLADALWDVPGATFFAPGREGVPTQLFLRGADADQTLFLVDGIRLNDGLGSESALLGGWRVNAADMLEIDRGPQSALYGTGAAAGVVALWTPAGVGPRSESIEVDGGTFDTVQTTLRAQGSGIGYNYNFADSAGETDNGRSNNEYKSNNLALRIDYRLDPTVVIGATFRSLNEQYEDPESTLTNSRYAHDTDEDLIGTLFAKLNLGQDITGKVTVGGVFHSLSTYEGAAPPLTDDRMGDERAVVDAQVTGRLAATDTLTVGADREESMAKASDPFVDAHEITNSYYAEDVYAPMPEVTVTGSVRRDDTNTWGAVDTERATVAWLGASHLIKLRGSFGTGFTEPSLADLSGIGRPDFVGNPKLQPENSRGWDAGFDFYLPQDAAQVLSITWFDTDYTNQIEYAPAAGGATTTANIGHSRTRGLEVAWTTRLAGAFQAKFGYTYLLADDLTNRVQLLYRPRDAITAEVFLDAKNGFTFGAGADYVGRRPDVDLQTPSTDIWDPAYTVARVYSRYRFNGHWAIHAKVENALDRRYFPLNGYSAAPLEVIGGVDFSF